MENGEYKVSLDTLFSILSVFGMDIGEFFREELAPSGPTERDHELLRLFHRLDAQAQDEILDFVRYKGLRRAVSCES
jgi:transcriptional regulator with XRE-family HTH domain